MPLNPPPLFVPQPPAVPPPHPPVVATGQSHPRRQPHTGEEWHAFANTICADVLAATDLASVEKIKADNATLLNGLKTADRWLASMVSAAFADKRKCLGSGNEPAPLPTAAGVLTQAPPARP